MLKLAGVLVAVAGCASTSPRITLQPDMGLAAVQRPAVTAQRYGAQRITAVQDSAGRYRYEDSLIAVTFAATESRIVFDMQNLSDTPIQINWNEAAFVDLRGQSQPLMHGGIKYTDCAAAKPPSVLAAKGRLTDSAVPCNYVQQHSDAFFSWWTEESFLGSLTTSVDSAASFATIKTQELKGKPIKLLLPIKTQDYMNDYTFSFDVRGVGLPTANGGWTGWADGTQRLTLNLNAANGVVTGTGSLAGTRNGTEEYRVSGTTNGTAITATLKASTYSIELRGTMTGPSITGTMHGAGFSGNGFIVYRWEEMIPADRVTRLQR